LTVACNAKNRSSTEANKNSPPVFQAFASHSSVTSSPRHARHARCRRHAQQRLDPGSGLVATSQIVKPQHLAQRPRRCLTADDGEMAERKMRDQRPKPLCAQRRTQTRRRSRHAGDTADGGNSFHQCQHRAAATEGKFRGQITVAAECFDREHRIGWRMYIEGRVEWFEKHVRP
jgi:hypothetical protein